jgi:hypothetical protein
MKRLLAVLLTATSFAAVPANATVRYDFTAFSSFDTNGEQITGGGFSFVASSFLTDDTNIPFGNLLSCSVSTTASSGTCLDQDMLFHVLQGYQTVSFGISTALNPSIGIYYYFDDGAFGAVGTYESQLFGADQAGRLVVTDLGGGAVPEPATWAMMIAGFGAVGFAMRRRQNVTVSFA